MEAPSTIHVPSSFDVLHKENIEKSNVDEALCMRHREKKGIIVALVCLHVHVFKSRLHQRFQIFLSLIKKLNNKFNNCVPNDS